MRYAKNVNNIKKQQSHTKSSMPFRGPGHMMKSTQKAKDFKGTMRSLFSYLRPYRKMLVLAIFFAIISTAFSILSPKLLGNMTNQIVSDYHQKKAGEKLLAYLPADAKLPTGATGEVLVKHIARKNIDLSDAELELVKDFDFSQPLGVDFAKLEKIVYILVVLYILSSIFSYIQGWIMSLVSQKVSYNFRRELSQKINKLPLRYYDKKTHGDILSRITNDVDTVSQTLNQSLSQIVSAITMIIGILILMFSINWLMTLTTLFFLPLSFFIVGMIIKKSQVHFKRQQDKLGELNGHIEEMYSGHSVMKVFNGEKRSVEKFQKVNNAMYDSAWKAQFLSGLMWPIMHFMGNLTFVAVSVLGAWLAIKGKVRIGDIQAFIQYVRQFNQPIVQISNIANVLQSTAASAERVFEFLEEEEESLEDKKTNNLQRTQGAVEFKNVSFAYKQDEPVIKDMNFQIQPGQRVAIVGPTGAGKTTIVNLLMRFYDINQGNIYIDGVDIATLRREHLRNQFSMVLQDTWLFNGTIRDNILYARPHAKDNELAEALASSHVDQFINALPQGLDMPINEMADNLSQGEKQLITIARAMLADSPILILDEATSSVDTRTEHLIQKGMDKLMHGRTSFVIAHRLSTIKDADLILVMNQGKLIEQGTHQTLLDEKGFYAELYHSQYS